MFFYQNVASSCLICSGEQVLPYWNITILKTHDRAGWASWMTMLKKRKFKHYWSPLINAVTARVGVGGCAHTSRAICLSTVQTGPGSHGVLAVRPFWLDQSDWYTQTADSAEWGQGEDRDAHAMQGFRQSKFKHVYGHGTKKVPRCQILTPLTACPGTLLWQCARNQERLVTPRVALTAG